jgi:hypothetical protein
MEAVHCPNKDSGRPSSLHDEMSRVLCTATKGNESWHQRDRQFEGAGVPLHQFNSEIPNSWLGRLKVHARRMSRAVSQSELIEGDRDAFGGAHCKPRHEQKTPRATIDLQVLWLPETPMTFQNRYRIPNRKRKPVSADQRKLIAGRTALQIHQGTRT